MKEIKAYVRCTKAEEVVHALEDAGAPGLTVIKVLGFGGASVPEEARWSLEYAEKTCTVVKIELVCSDEDTERYVDVIKDKARTGHSGDGMIFVSDIVGAIKIRSGEEDEEALRP